MARMRKPRQQAGPASIPRYRALPLDTTATRLGAIRLP